MRIPEIVPEVRPVVLRNPLRKPRGNDEAGDRIGNDDVGIAVQHIETPFGLIAKPLEVDGRHRAAELHRRLYLYDMRVLVRDDVAQPVVGAA